eukprot:CAMPEP_0171663400 /NCGR_PEP_ID=MMETSP0990-20121206/46150_1 /TAXON_ID=483369 /ORGANISM="non described non described, Strain CCMP2098" /LENGTH=80 /DNA_ID=CAMNT_0012246049 /DNA_START=237 /DNA_END=479 /DNA_ORIENTATION=+
MHITASGRLFSGAAALAAAAAERNSASSGAPHFSVASPTHSMILSWPTSSTSAEHPAESCFIATFRNMQPLICLLMASAS